MVISQVSGALQLLTLRQPVLIKQEASDKISKRIPHKG